MTYPIISDKYRDNGTVKALDIFLMSNGVSKLSKLPKPPLTCILCPSRFILQYLGKDKKLKEGPKIINPIYFLNPNTAVFSGFIGFGAPMWAWVLEQLIAYGIKDFVYIGFFGLIDNKFRKEKLFIVERSLRDEGLSYHYAEPSQWAYPDKCLTKMLLSQEKTEGSKVWTTDAMFKQTRKEIAYAKSNNIIGFEMETSALFCVAAAKKCRIASILVESDSYLNGKWRRVYGTKPFDRRLRKAIDLAVKVLDKPIIT